MDSWAATILAFVLRLDLASMKRYGPAILLSLLLVVPVQLGVFRWLGLHRRYWCHATVDEMPLIARAVAASAIPALSWQTL